MLGRQREGYAYFPDPGLPAIEPTQQSLLAGPACTLTSLCSELLLIQLANIHVGDRPSQSCFLFSIFYSVTISEEVGWSRRGCPSPDQAILTESIGNMSFISKPTLPSPNLYHLLIYFPCPRSPRTEPQATRDHARAQSHPKLSKLHPHTRSSTHPASPLASHENPNNSSGSCSSFSLLSPPDQLWSFPTWPCLAWQALFSLEI